MLRGRRKRDPREGGGLAGMVQRARAGRGYPPSGSGLGDFRARLKFRCLSGRGYLIRTRRHLRFQTRFLTHLRPFQTRFQRFTFQQRVR